METEHVPCEGPDYSYLIGKKPDADGPPLRLESCSCGLLVLHAPCAACQPLRSACQSADAPLPSTDTRGSAPLVLAGLLAFGTLVFLAESIATGTPRPSEITQGLD